MSGISIPIPQAFASVLLLNEGLMRLTFVVSVLLAGSIVFLVILRMFVKPSRTSRGGIDLDTDFLDGVSKSSLLSEQERRRVRDALVRQAIEKGAENDARADMNALLNIAAQAQIAHAVAGSEPDTKVRKSRSVAPSAENAQGLGEGLRGEGSSATPSEPAREAIPEAADEASPVPPKDKPVDIDTLFERGLIGKDEYLRLRGHFGKSRSDRK